MSEVKVSIIIPFYNSGQYLRRCLDSAVNQYLDDYEIVCINDGSTDISLSIAVEFTRNYPRLKVISQENRGLSNARNRGMSSALGEYLMFLDADDYLEANVLAELYETCTLDKLDILDFKINVVRNGIIKRMYPEQGRTTGVYEGRTFLTEYIRKHRRQPFVSAWSHLYRREFIAGYGFQFIAGRKYEDLLFTANAYIKARAVKYLDLPVYNYVKVEGSITTSGISREHIADLQFMTREISNLSESSGVRIPMDNFFSGIRNQVITARKTGRWKEYRSLFDRELFRKTVFNLYRTSFRIVYPAARMSYSLFVVYCDVTSVLKQLIAR